MSAIYCSQCGKKHEYNLAKPNFCSSCGNPLGATMPSFKKKQPIKEDKGDDYDDDDDDDDIDDDDDKENYSSSLSVPSIRKIAVDIESSSPYNKFSLSSIIGTGKEESAPKTKRRAQTLEDFKNNKNK